MAEEYYKSTFKTVTAVKYNHTGAATISFKFTIGQYA